MKKIIKSLFLSFFFILTMTSMTKAEELHSWDIKVQLQNNGSALIENTIDFTPTKGTEFYIPIENLSKSEIKNFTVKEINNSNTIPYSYKEWNTKESLEEKRDKYGFVRKDKGVELCWGIGDYNRKTFKVNYEVTNFIKKLNDSDMIFWKFINDNLSAPPKRVTIRVTAPFGLYEKDTQIWGFGMSGKINFDKMGNVIFQNDRNLKSDNYSVILMKFKKDRFSLGEKIDKNFEYYQSMAFEGSSYETGSKIFKFQNMLLFMIIVIFIILSIGGAKRIERLLYPRNAYKKGDFKEEYKRDIPEREWWKTLVVLRACYFDNAGDDMIKAFFLKWIEEGLLTPYNENKLIVNKKKKNFLSESEEDLYDIISFVASTENGNIVIDKKNFKRHFKRKGTMEDMLKFSMKLKEESYSFLESKNFLLNKRTLTEEGKEYSADFIKFYNFLKDFTILDERELKEIKVWKELLIYATLFGVAETVKEKLEGLSPKFIEEIKKNGFDDRTFNAFTTSAIYSNALREAARVGGLGGASSIGGGGGSFGGGSGGGSR